MAVIGSGIEKRRAFLASDQGKAIASALSAAASAPSPVVSRRAAVRKALQRGIFQGEE